MTRLTPTQFVAKSRGKGISASQIAIKMNEAGYRRPKNNDEYKTVDVYSLYKGIRDVGPTTRKMRTRRKPEMLEITPATSGRVAVVIGSVEDVLRVVNGL